MSFTIGCDPELLCRREGRYVPAHHYFKQNSSFGLDGCENIAELRPGFSESPVDLTAKIKIVLEYGHQKAPDLDLFAGHYQDSYPLGGHLHFALQPDPLIIDALDVVLHSLSNCIDNREQRTKREHSGYGKRKCIRRKQWGFEFRSPGSFFVITLNHTRNTYTRETGCHRCEGG